MASILYPPLRIRDIPGPQPGQFGVVRKERCSSVTSVFLVARKAIPTGQEPRRPEPRTRSGSRGTRETQSRSENRIEQDPLRWTLIDQSVRCSSPSRGGTTSQSRRPSAGRSTRTVRGTFLLISTSLSLCSLRELLAGEEAQYLQEATGSKETLSQRIGKMRQKAKRIREEKESEHAKLVQDKYDQRFRRDCAELRELQSKELEYELGNEHLWQMQEKVDRKKELKVGTRPRRNSSERCSRARRKMNSGLNCGTTTSTRRRSAKTAMRSKRKPNPRAWPKWFTNKCTPRNRNEICRRANAKNIQKQRYVASDFSLGKSRCSALVGSIPRAERREDHGTSREIAETRRTETYSWQSSHVGSLLLSTGCLESVF